MHCGSLAMWIGSLPAQLFNGPKIFFKVQASCQCVPKTSRQWSILLANKLQYILFDLCARDITHLGDSDASNSLWAKYVESLFSTAHSEQCETQSFSVQMLFYGG